MRHPQNHMNNGNIVSRTLTQIALWLASLGFHILPVHAVSSGLCTCGNSQCRSPGKHPRTQSGSKDSTRSSSTIAEWFDGLFGNGNIGIATGATAGIVVLDVDPRHGGEDSLAALETQHGELPMTPTSKTGGGGLHFFFAHPGDSVRNSANAVGPGLDVRGEGGFVVAPPSLHASGGRYEWLSGRGPDQVALALPPPWLVQAMRGERDAGSRPSDQGRRVEVRGLAGGGADEGGRNDAVARLFGHLVRRDVDIQVATDLMLAWNREKNRPPLPDDEVIAVMQSIAGTELRRRERRAGGRHD
ncbi:MAG: bifunctional DNA primase/polymerase [Anaeromyxobacteraceae bacterium]|nr:bifunctional DNA primase/polymerase [Anaeromyxobacteraceae bacterium]